MANGSDIGAATGLAGGAITGALLETLLDKGILDLSECRAVLDRALKSLTPLMQTPNGLRAAQILGAMQQGKFSARG